MKSKHKSEEKGSRDYNFTDMNALSINPDVTLHAIGDKYQNTAIEVMRGFFYPCDDNFWLYKERTNVSTITTKWIKEKS